MNYSEMLGKYKRAFLDFNDMKGVTTKRYAREKEFYIDLNNDIYNLFVEAHFLDGKYDFDVLSKGYMDKDGIYVDLSKLKEDLLKLFSIKPSNAVEELKELLSKDDSYYEEIIKSSPLNHLITTTIKYELENKKSGDEDKVRRTIFKRYCEILRERVRLTLELFENEKDYVKVNENVFDENRLKLYMAYKVIKHSKSFDEYSAKYEKCINYLKDYLQNNYSLPHDTINFEGYSIEEVGNYYAKAYKKMCEGEQIKKGVYKELGIEIKEEVDYDFDFFDFESLTKDEIMQKIQGTLKSNFNYVNYKEILERKIALYKEIPFKTVLKGKNKFEGYLGFVVDDKYVILDKFYNTDKSKHISIGNAIYIVSRDDFGALVTNSKSDAIELIGLGLLDAVRINHYGDYETRVKNYIKYGTKYVDDKTKRKQKRKAH